MERLLTEILFNPEVPPRHEELHPSHWRKKTLNQVFINAIFLQYLVVYKIFLFTLIFNYIGMCIAFLVPLHQFYLCSGCGFQKAHKWELLRRQRDKSCSVKMLSKSTVKDLALKILAKIILAKLESAQYSSFISKYFPSVLCELSLAVAAARESLWLHANFRKNCFIPISICILEDPDVTRHVTGKGDAPPGGGGRGVQPRIDGHGKRLHWRGGGGCFTLFHIPPVRRISAVLPGLYTWSFPNNGTGTGLTKHCQRDITLPLSNLCCQERVPHWVLYRQETASDRNLYCPETALVEICPVTRPSLTGNILLRDWPLKKIVLSGDCPWQESVPGRNPLLSGDCPLYKIRPWGDCPWQESVLSVECR